MFLVWLIGLFISFVCIDSIFNLETKHIEESWFVITITACVWFVLLFANFAESLTEYNSKKITANIQQFKETFFVRKIQNNIEIIVSNNEIELGSIIKVKAGEIIPCDGEVIQGISTVDESAITGESATVIRDNMPGKNFVLSGTKVVSDFLIIRVTGTTGSDFLNKLSNVSMASARKPSLNEVAIHKLLFGYSIIYVVVCLTFFYIAQFVGIDISIATTTAFLICILPTTVSALMSTISISGAHRLLRKNIIPLSTQSMEVAGDIDILLIDKTGTVTSGNRIATEITPMHGIEISRLVKAAGLSSFADATPEGRSILTFLNKRYKFNIPNVSDMSKYQFIPFTASTRISGCNTENMEIRKGSYQVISSILKENNIEIPQELYELTKTIGLRGETPLVIIENLEVLGVITLKDSLKFGVKARIEKIQSLGIKVILISGDNYYTTKTIAREIGIDDFIYDADPDAKLKKVKELQEEGYIVGVTGDGVNDAPALSQADLGYTINSASQLTKEAANIIDLDNDCTKVLELIEISRELLSTRGCITTFSLISDLAKYFAILPIIAGAFYPEMLVLNFMNLTNPYTAISSAMLFNSLAIMLLLPLALRGIKYRPLKTSRIVKEYFLIFGIGGLITPIFFIKLIDMSLNYLLGIV